MGKVPSSLARRSLADDVANAIVSLIESEDLKDGDGLPPITELSDRLHVSRTIVREAIDQLCERGVLERSGGRQWAVAGDHRSLALRPLRPPREERISHRSLADQAADAVLELIASGGLREGDPLPPSGELARRYGVSIVVIREALASLAARGILQRRQGRESVVAMPGSEILSSIMRVRARLEDIETDEFQVCRASLEVRAAELAALAPDPESKRELLGPCLERMRRAKSQKAFNDADLAFHLALADLSGNKAISLILEALNDLVRENIAITYSRVRARHGAGGVDMARQYHEEVAEAVYRGDAEGAAEAMTGHFKFSAGEP